ncbi:MAG TPA: hypothetical protein VE575_06540 [Acidimicrobiales bacterium]|nr:hypothetical protein [Acidimicrobiales bacterium]
MRRMRVVVAVLVVGVLGTACGDDGGGRDGGDVFGGGDGGGSGAEASSERGQEYVEALRESADDDENFTQEEVDCLATAMVEAVGVDNLDNVTSPDELADSDLSEVGLTLDEQQGDALWEEMGGCLDFRQLFLDQLEQDQGLPAEAVDCLDGAMSDDFLQRVFVTSLVEGEEALDQDEELNDELLEVFQECPEVLGG